MFVSLDSWLKNHFIVLAKVQCFYLSYQKFCENFFNYYFFSVSSCFLPSKGVNCSKNCRCLYMCSV